MNDLLFKSQFNHQIASQPKKLNYGNCDFLKLLQIYVSNVIQGQFIETLSF